MGVPNCALNIIKVYGKSVLFAILGAADIL
jgi:hypothetical protein